MKKFSKIAALSMALALTFGMTVCAADSTDAYKEMLATAQATADNTKAVDSSTGVAVTLTKTAATVDDIKAADTAVESPTSALSQTVAQAAGVADVAKVTEVKLLVMMDITPDPAADGTEITVTIPYQVTSATGKSFVLMHQRGDKWEFAASYDAENGGFVFKGVVGKDFSNYAVFEVTEDTTPTPEQTPQQPTQQPTQQTETPVSPKTGGTVPVAVFAAVILLAGAAVCAKKAQMNH